MSCNLCTKLSSLNQLLLLTYDLVSNLAIKISWDMIKILHN